ncbi:MAG TPA: hypothetical protein DCY78_00120 [Acidimicrobiaceae bacterium]|nr:hypothetical protein [Acidimicrobiaceae bacterium]
MRILVTNDDGIDSDGLHELARALVDLGDVTVVAPDSEYSGAGASLGAMHLIRPEVHDATSTGWTGRGRSAGPPASASSTAASASSATRSTWSWPGSTRG